MVDIQTMKRTVSERARAQLRKIRKELKKRGVASKLTDATISRALSGKVRPSAKTLRRIVELLDVELGCQLVATYLAEDIPPKLRGHICIGVRSDKEQREEICQCWDPFVRKLLALPPETRIALDAIADAILNALPGDKGKERLTYLFKSLSPKKK
jgi:transcriptional regulator with XRE-family HTH domain